MVRTTKGPAEKSKPKKAAEEPTPVDTRAERLADLDDETWDRVVAMGRSQQIDPVEVIRRAIVQTYGSATVTGAYHSGDRTDTAGS